MAIDQTTTVPKIIAAQLLIAYRQRKVFADRVNNSWRSLLGNGGNEVIINQPGAASIQDYTRNTNLTYAGVDAGAPQTIRLNKAKSWAIKYDDLDRAVSSVDLLRASVVEHGEMLALSVDADIRASMLAQGPQGLADFTIDHEKTGGLSYGDLKLASLHRMMDLSSVPKEGRWIIVGPYMAEVIQQIALANETLLSTNTTASLRNGLLGSFGGFNWYVWGNPAWSDFTARAVAASSGNPAKKANSARETIVYGIDRATPFIDRMRRTERLRLEGTFADAVRGLYEYGSSVIKPTGQNWLHKTTITVENIPG